MTSHLTFTQEPIEKPREQWITFDVGGTALDGKTWSESFTCLPEIPGGAIDDLTASVGIDEQQRMTFNKLSVLRFMRSVIVPEDEGRFSAMVHDKNRLLKLDLLGEVMMKVAEAVTGRPFGFVSTLDSGDSSTAATSPPA